jgi:hypothetical protein
MIPASGKSIPERPFWKPNHFTNALKSNKAAMKLTILQSDKGDCLLLESADGHRILCDGGMTNSMKDHVSPALTKLCQPQNKIDFVYVSHIDQDHINGVLQLLRTELDWRVYQHHRDNGDTSVKKPACDRPPEIGGIWHNAFRDQVDMSGKVEDLLAAAVPALLATRVPDLQEAGEELYDIATAVPEAIEVSKLVAKPALNIPLNKIPGSNAKRRLLMARKNQPSFNVGSMKLTIIGPTAEELKKLRQGWNTWLSTNGPEVERINKKLKEKLDEFSTSAGAPPSIDLGDWNGVPNYKGVTAPNIASLMFMVEEADGKRLLLTGDSQQKFILDGLRSTGFLTGDSLHVDVLKVQHHGSEKNMDAEFARTVSADHYVFCGNGEHENPDLGVIDIIYQSRLGTNQSKLARSPIAQERKFTMWFSSSAALGPDNQSAQTHMEELERVVKQLAKGSKGKMKARFNKKPYLVLPV